MQGGRCKLHRRAREFILSEPGVSPARAWLLSDDPEARQCGGCRAATDPGRCEVDRWAILWAKAERWETTYHQPHRPHTAETLLRRLREAVESEE